MTTVLIALAAAAATAATSAPSAPKAAAPAASAEMMMKPMPKPVPADFLGGLLPATPGPVDVAPALPALKTPDGMMDHATIVGWSTDGSELGYCAPAGGVGGTTCVFRHTDGKEERVTDFDEKTGEPSPARAKALADRVKAKGYGTGRVPWAFASDLAITWKVLKADERATLKVGARLKAAPAAVVYPISIECDDWMDWCDIHPEAIALSPDGRWLGVVSHAYAGEYSDTFHIRVIDVSVLAGRAYNLAGYLSHKKKAWAKSVPLFRKAAAADPAFGLAVYNLACALARTKDVAAGAALRRAIELGGPVVRKRALKDADFETVRAEAWFGELTK
jgi:hypothetical protein